MSDLGAEQKYNEARMLLDHPLLKEAFADVREEMTQSIEALQFGTPEGEILKDKLMMGLQALKEVKDKIYSKIEDYQVELIKQQEEGNE